MHKKHLDLESELKSAQEKYLERIQLKEQEATDTHRQKEDLAQQSQNMQANIKLQFAQKLKEMHGTVEEAQRQNKFLQTTVEKLNGNIKEKDQYCGEVTTEYEKLKAEKKENEGKVQQYCDQLKQGYEMQLQAMLDQYTQKLDSYEDQLKKLTKARSTIYSDLEQEKQDKTFLEKSMQDDMKKIKDTWSQKLAHKNESLRQLEDDHRSEISDLKMNISTLSTKLETEKLSSNHLEEQLDSDKI